MSIVTQIKRAYSVEPKREQRAQELIQTHAVSLTKKESHRVRAVVNGHHTCEVKEEQDGTLEISCTCQDWRTRGMATNMPCKHILSLAMVIDARGLMMSTQTSAAKPSNKPLAPPPPGTRKRTKQESFADQIKGTIHQAVVTLADQVEAVLAGDGIPFLIGPTGCGKTSATRLVATRNSWGFEEVAGAHSFADSDLVGLRTDQMEMPGIFARAFKRARNGEPVLLFLDEATRFNVRSMDILMRPLQVAAPNVAQAMGISVDEPVRIVEAPLWGIEFAPADQVHIALAANPWGSVLDPALIRRVEPIQVQMADGVADLFADKLADAIRASWKSVERGELPLPIEYQSLSTAQDASDTGFLRMYLTRLQVLDPAAADGYQHLLDGLGLNIEGGGG